MTGHTEQEDLLFKRQMNSRDDDRRLKSEERKRKEREGRERLRREIAEMHLRPSWLLK